MTSQPVEGKRDCRQHYIGVNFAREFKPGIAMYTSVRFGVFEFDSTHRVLRKHGLKIRVPGQSIEILAALVEHPGETLPRERIRALLWPHGTVVDFQQSISTAVTRLREAIGDSSNNPRFIERVPGQGYRFIATVEPLPEIPSHAREVRAGAGLLHYRLIENIGQGSMGEVWKAEDTRLGRTVAIKILPERLVDDPGAQQALRAEARRLAILSEPAICAIHGIEEQNGRWFLVMEYIAGHPLNTVLAGEPLSLVRTLDIGVQAAEALAAAHKAGIIHRDLKPANFILNSEGKLKLTDFGIAEVVRGAEGVSVGKGPLSLTGTLEYMSPEQARGESADARSDLFSLGVVLYEVATGKLPFEGETASALLESIVSQAPPPPRSLNPSLPRELERVIVKALEKDPSARWQSAVEMGNALRKIQNARTGGSLRLHRWAYTAAAVLALVLITGLWPRSQPKVRVTSLTADALWKYPVLVVNHGRVLYTAGPSMGWLGNNLWSVPSDGGEPRREPKPCATDSSSPYLFGVSYPQRRMLVQCQEPVEKGYEAQFWLIGFDHGSAKWIGNWDFFHEPDSISPDLQTLLFNNEDSISVRPINSREQRLLLHVDRSTPIDMAGAGWHPSGTRITLSRWKNGMRTLWEMRTDGTGLHPLLPDFSQSQEDWSWSADGQRLYFTSGGDIYLLGPRSWLGWMRRAAPVHLTSGPMQFGPPFEDPTDPLSVFAVGGMPQAMAMKLNRRSNVFEPFLGGIPAESVDYSPDGRWIAYVKWPRGQLWKASSDGTRKTLLVDGLRCGDPHWSPDGKRIVFRAKNGRRTDASRQPHIYTISASGGQPEMVPRAKGAAADPTWSPDGKQLAFAPAPPLGEVSDDQRHISIVNMETGTLEAVPGLKNLWSPRWSPDGHWLAALGPDGLVLYSFRTGKVTRLGPTNVGYPHWSKDSRYIYALLSRPIITLVRFPVAKPGNAEPIREIPEFIVQWGAYWTPDDEPIVLRNLTTYQIYRVDRDR